jgi:iron-sulfur cluster repair protein YtfE (RIC family)
MRPADDAFARLLAEHDEFGEKLVRFEAVLDEMMAQRTATEGNRERIDEALRFFDEELLPHFRREEEIVLPPLAERVGRYGSLVNVVEYEHDEIRRELRKLKEARDGLTRPGDPWPAIREINRHGVFTIQFLADHFRKERTSLFPTARKTLAVEDLATIRSKLART